MSEPIFSKIGDMLINFFIDSMGPEQLNVFFYVFSDYDSVWHDNYIGCNEKVVTSNELFYVHTKISSIKMISSKLCSKMERY